MAKKNRDSNSAYLTKRRLLSDARSGVKQAAEETMNLIGYNVVAKDGGKLFADGTVEKITPIPDAKSTANKTGIVLD